MDPSLEKILLLVGGGILAILGAWLNDLRSERKRKKEKVEEAYVLWLNNEILIKSQIEQLIEIFSRKIDTPEIHQELSEKYEKLNIDLQNLTHALHIALIYENNNQKKEAIDNLTRAYVKITNFLELQIKQKRLKLDYNEIKNVSLQTISKQEVNLQKFNTISAVLEQLKTPIEQSKIESNEHIKEEFVDIYNNISSEKKESEENLAVIRKNLDDLEEYGEKFELSISDIANDINEQMEIIKKVSPIMRQIIIKQR